MYLPQSFFERTRWLSRPSLLRHVSPPVAHHDISHLGATLVASLIGHLESSTFRLSDYPPPTALMSLAGSCFSSESAPGPSIMGFEDEAEQSIGRPCRQTNGRFKRPSELTSSIVPRGTSV